MLFGCCSYLYLIYYAVLIVWTTQWTFFFIPVSWIETPWKRSCIITLIFSSSLNLLFSWADSVLFLQYAFFSFSFYFWTMSNICVGTSHLQSYCMCNFKELQEKIPYTVEHSKHWIVSFLRKLSCIMAFSWNDISNMVFSPLLV